jgi:hypothetical protein
MNDQYWPGVRNFAKWADSTDGPRFILRRIKHPHSTRGILLYSYIQNK